MATKKTETAGALAPSLLIEQARKGTLGPVHVLVGEDAQTIARINAAVKAAYVPPESQDFCLETISGDDDAVTAGHIVAAAETMSMFGGCRVVWVKHADAMPASELEALAGQLDVLRSRSDLVLVLVCSALDKRTKFFKVVQAAGIVVDCSVGAVSDVAAALLERHGKQMAPDAARLLQERVGSDANLAWQELEKLSLYLGDRAMATREDVLLVCADTALRNEWEIADRLLEGDAGGALVALQDMRRNAQDPIYQHTIVAMSASRVPAARAAALDGSLQQRWREFRLGRNSAGIERRLRATKPPTVTASLRWIMYADIAVKGTSLPAELLTDMACLITCGLP